MVLLMVPIFFPVAQALRLWPDLVRGCRRRPTRRPSCSWSSAWRRRSGG